VIPSEIAAQLDFAAKCVAFTISGACLYSPIRGEQQCLMHSTSIRGQNLRDRNLILLRAQLRREWRLGHDFLYPAADGRFISDSGEIVTFGSARTSDKSSDQSNPGETSPPLDENEERERRQQRIKAYERGQIALLYFAAEQEREARIALRQFKRSASSVPLLPEDLSAELMLPESGDKSGSPTAGEDASAIGPTLFARPMPRRIFFRGDLTTPQGICAAADSLLRAHMARRISVRRAEAVIRFLRITMATRMMGAASPINGPDNISSRPGDLILDADLSTSADRDFALRELRKTLNFSLNPALESAAEPCPGRPPKRLRRIAQRRTKPREPRKSPSAST
jgi:hypothetical protein